MTAVQRLMCDQLEFSQAMTDAYQGLYYIAVAALVRKGIKPYNWPEVDEQVFGARFKLFARVPVPKYVDYETFAGNLKHDEQNMSLDQLLAEGKGHLTIA